MPKKTKIAAGNRRADRSGIRVLKTTTKSTCELFEFTAAVSSLMLAQYGINWADACGDREPLVNGHSKGLSPQEFVEDFGERQGLTYKAEVGA